MSLQRRQVILLKEEATYGTDSIPTAASNSIIVYEPQVKENFEIVERGPVLPSMGRFASLAGQKFIEITFKTELILSGAAGTAPRLGDAFEACGMAETINAGVDVQYDPASTSHKSVTIYAQIDGRQYKILGARGSWKIIAAVGQPCMIEWTFRGLYSAPTDTALGTPTLESTIPAVMKSANFTLNAVTSLVLQQIEIDLQNNFVKRDDLNSIDGIKGFEIVDRQPICNINPEMVSVATYDFRGDWEGSTPRQLSFTIGSAAGNKCTISCPKFNIKDISYADREQIIIEQISGELAINSGDDEINIKME